MQTATHSSIQTMREATAPQQFTRILHELLSDYGLGQDGKLGVERNGAPPLDIQTLLLELAQGIYSSVPLPQDSIRSRAPPYPPLELVTRPNLKTEEAAFYLNRAPQTLRAWACLERFPKGLRCKRIGGLLAWPTAQIKELAGLAAQ